MKHPIFQKMQYAIFDLDGTVLDSMPIWMHLGETVLKSLRVIPDEDLNKRFKTMTLEQSSKYLTEVYELPLNQKELMALFVETVKSGYESTAPLKPGVGEFLSLLQKNKIPMCVATASERSLAEAALQRTGILSCFEFVLTCSELRKTKETPEVYLEAMRRLGGTTENTVIFEDAEASVISAKNGGFPVVAVYDESAKANRETIQKLADYYIESFAELLD